MIAKFTTISSDDHDVMSSSFPNLGHQSRLNGYSAENQQQQQRNSQIAPQIKPRQIAQNGQSLPPRPMPRSAAANAYANPTIDPSTGMSIYENFADQQSNTPNFVPAAVYRAKAPGPTPSSSSNQGRTAGFESVTVNLIRQPTGFGFRLIGGTEVPKYKNFDPIKIFFRKAPRSKSATSRRAGRRPWTIVCIVTTRLSTWTISQCCTAAISRQWLSC